MMLAAILFWYPKFPSEKYHIPIPMWHLFFVSLLLAATSHDAGGDTFLIHTISLPTVSITNSYVFLRLCITIASSSIGCCWQRYFFDTQNLLPKSITYQFLWEIYFLYHCCSQLHHMMLAAILFWYTQYPSQQYQLPIPMYFWDYVSLSLAASLDVAGSDTFSIPKITQKQYHLLSPAQIHSLRFSRLKQAKMRGMKP